MKLIDGRAISKEILEKVKQEVAKKKQPPGLAIILVGDDPASKLYINIKERACKKTGIHFEKYLFRANVTESDVVEKIQELNQRSEINGIVVQLPLPKHLDEDRIILAISPEKDADGFHPVNTTLLLTGEMQIIPALAQSIMHLLRSTKVNLMHKKALVIAHSRVFYNFLAYLLQQEKIQSDFALPDKGLKLSDRADILIIAAGQPKYISVNNVKEGAIIIDVGINQTPTGVVGDVDAAALENISGYLTPVPGGVGPVTVASLLDNVVKLSK